MVGLADRVARLRRRDRARPRRDPQRSRGSPVVIWGTAAAVGVVALALAGAIAHTVVRAAPDEWLLQVRNGRLLASGVGLVVWRWPGDQVVRFTSTVQRVRFDAVITDADLLPV